MGPNGEDVIFEEDKKDISLADRLAERFLNGPLFLEASQDGDYYVWMYRKRIYHSGE